MSITLTSSYRIMLAPATIDKIDELLDENYDRDAMLVFIDEYNEKAFVEVYEEYVRCGEAIGYEAVDALASESGIDCIVDCDERYHGCYQSTADFAEEFHTSNGAYIPDGIEVDWEATWDRNLYYDFTACNDGSTYCPMHIFRDN
ncbi:hypothetical protein S-PM2d072 [Synechococcus phage S-PM2]|uniref:Hypothetical-Protein / belonging to T4-LIKE GC: 813 n=1 Tax=Synechococcus phage S-PM2 TaxID=238854 RepID=Q5GQU8_BPSYP|nr:anti-restriction protein [Synechococcus phage S-PM2]CAF34136.1 Hypothetical-Protein / belonging to T4-LIKE GC: 813 [Synechococcus phage S-PM2]CFW42188.1 hypothetical protein S-PM2d072 [Synechococcus phage S-PM2]